MRITRRTEYLLEDDKGRLFHIEREPVSHIDPVVEDVEDGVLVRYAVHDGDAPDFDFPEDVEFRLFRNRTEASQFQLELNTCTCGSPLRYHRNVIVNNSSNFECPDNPGNYFKPEQEWTQSMFWVDKYEHGFINYVLGYESVMIDRAWDILSHAGVLTVPTNLVTKEDRSAYARAFLALYTAWCNGEVYGAIQELHRLVGNKWERFLTDDYWGYIGVENVETVVEKGL